MNLPAFDTLEYTKSLEASGIDRKEAEAHAKAQMASLSALMEEKLATKEDLSAVKTGLKQDIADLKTELKQDIAELKIELRDFKVDLIKWMVGLMVGWGAILISVMTVLKLFVK